MPHKDPEARKKYNRERYKRIQDEDPEKWARLQEKHRRAYEKKLAKGEDAKRKIAEDYKRWYDQHGKENARERKGYIPWEEYQQNLAAARKHKAEYMRGWGQTEAGQRNRTAQSVKKRCGLTIKEYDKAYEQQEGKCKICGVQRERYGKDRLVVDHCHISERFRALLCGLCNTAIGMLGEDTERMRKAIEYVESWKVIS
jgi:hypothetical protein